MAFQLQENNSGCQSLAFRIFTFFPWELAGNRKSMASQYFILTSVLAKFQVRLFYGLILKAIGSPAYFIQDFARIIFNLFIQVSLHQLSVSFGLNLHCGVHWSTPLVHKSEFSDFSRAQCGAPCLPCGFQIPQQLVLCTCRACTRLADVATFAVVKDITQIWQNRLDWKGLVKFITSNPQYVVLQT